MFDKFYKHSARQRREILHENGHYNFDLDVPMQASLYEAMIENSVTTYEIPMGVVANFVLNDTSYIVPMVIEEPSVLAAQNNAAKIFRENGGIKARVIKREMRGEIAFFNPEDSLNLVHYIETHQEVLFDLCAKTYPNIVKRGGGVRAISTRILSDNSDLFVIVDVVMDTQEAMGANMINTVLEALKIHLEDTLNETALMAILSNYADTCVVEASVSLDVSSLKNSPEIGQRMAQASRLAHVDVYRATTHNKGIMNGIDALIIATGNDFRAIEAGAHAYASRHGSYASLTTWTLENETHLIGRIELPMALGTVGGTISIHPKAKLSYEILGTNDAQTLMQIAAGVGLAQNFSAMYALTSDGIQKGHMRMHARTLLIQAGCPFDLLNEALQIMMHEKPLTLDKATEIVARINQ